MKKVVFIFGTRPEFIKLFPLIKKFNESKFESVIVNTGQHKEMLDNLLEDFDIKPNYNLNTLDNANGLCDVFTYSLTKLNEVVSIEKPDLIFVHGDTSATLAGTMAAYYNQIKVAHVEAGLRTDNLYSPFPEEGNRQLTGVIADLHFAPTEMTKDNLLKEGKDASKIFVVGNSAIDTLNYTVSDKYESSLTKQLEGEKFLLVTVHRRENLEVLSDIFEAFNEIADKHNIKIIYPIHMNPYIRELAKKHIKSDNIRIIEPLETREFQNVMSKSHLIITDSGGIQEEAPALGKPVLVIRDTTERPEGVMAGTLKLIGTKKENIIKHVNLLLEEQNEYDLMAGVKNPYGDGTTSEKILKIVEEYLN